MENSNDKIYSVLGYFGPLFLIPLLAGETEFARYHANQGLVLFIFDAILGTIIGVISAVIGIIPVAGPIISGVVGGVLGLVILAYMICGIVHAANEEMKPLPIIGEIKLIK